MRAKIVTVLLAVGAIGWAGTALGAEAAAGKAIYEKSCQGCHGADGKGNPGMAKVLGEKGLNLTLKETTQKSDEQLMKIIVDGAGKMPPQKLTKDQQKQVVGYVRSLSK
jgi:mono/diheme cytochrome c family protein